MVYSMTGFASTTLTLNTPTASIPATLSLKTLNGRFIEVNCKLPYVFSYLETEIIKLCKEKLERGSVYVTLSLSSPHALKTTVVPSYGLAEGYVKAIETLQKNLNLPGTITINDVIKLEHLFETAEPDVIDNTAIMKALYTVIAQVNQSRAQEGAALAQDLHKRMDIIEQQVNLLEPRAQQVRTQRMEQFAAELQPFLSATPTELKELHLQTLYGTLDRMDVHEEIVRLRNHIVTFSSTLNDNQIQKGKKLDFILQEMFRETNTISSKLPDTQASGSIITIKVELEKAREQVQNIV